MATNRSLLSSSNNIWPNYMIPLSFHHFASIRITDQHINNISVVTRHCTRKHLSRPSYNTCPKRSPLWNSPVHYFRSLLLCWILLSILPLKPCPHSTLRRTLTTNRYHPAKSPRSTPSKYLRTTRIRSYNHLSPS